jgi:type II secretion system protein N
VATRSPQRVARTRARAGRSGGFPISLAALAALLLFVLFVLLGFPYEVLARRVARTLEPTLGARISFGSAGPGLGLSGPGVTARDVQLLWPDAPALQFERLSLRPAWSLSWLRGRPALQIGLAGELGRLDATVWPGSVGGLEGEVHRLDLEGLPLEAWRPGLDLAGILDGQFQLARDGAALQGTARFAARDGRLGLPVLPLALPYAALEGELRLAEGGLLEVALLELEGPMVGLSLEGSVGPAPQLEQAPLRLSGTLRVPDPAVRQAFAGQRIAFRPDAAAHPGAARAGGAGGPGVDGGARHGAEPRLAPSRHPA